MCLPMPPSWLVVVTVLFTDPQMLHRTCGLKCQPTFLMQPYEKVVNPVITIDVMGCKGLCKANWLHLFFLPSLPSAPNSCHYS